MSARFLSTRKSWASFSFIFIFSFIFYFFTKKITIPTYSLQRPHSLFIFSFIFYFFINHDVYSFQIKIPTRRLTLKSLLVIQADRACGMVISPRLFVISFVILCVQYRTIYWYLTICDYVSSWQKEISDASMQATESHCCCTSSASHNQITAGMLERQMEWPNGRQNGRMSSESLERAALFQWC